MGTALVEENNVAIWVGDVSLTLSVLVHCVDPTPVGAVTHGPGLHGDKPLLRHLSRVYYLLRTPSGR